MHEGSASPFSQGLPGSMNKGATSSRLSQRRICDGYLTSPAQTLFHFCRVNYSKQLPGGSMSTKANHGPEDI